MTTPFFNSLAHVQWLPPSSPNHQRFIQFISAGHLQKWANVLTFGRTPAAYTWDYVCDLLARLTRAAQYWRLRGEEGVNVRGWASGLRNGRRGEGGQVESWVTWWCLANRYTVEVTVNTFFHAAASARDPSLPCSCCCCWRIVPQLSMIVKITPSIYLNFPSLCSKQNIL